MNDCVLDANKTGILVLGNVNYLECCWSYAHPEVNPITMLS